MDHIPGELLVDQILLVRAGSRQGQVVDLQPGNQFFQQIAVSLAVRDPLPGRKRIAEEQDPGSCGDLCLGKFMATAKTTLIDADEVAAPFMLNPGSNPGYETVADYRMIFK